MRKRSSDTANNIPWNLIVVFLLLSVGIIISGFIYYRYEKNRLIADNNQDISALAGLKVKQISDWRRARVSAASYLCDNDYFVDDVARYFNQQSVASESKLIRWLKPMKNGYNLSTILLFDNRGTIRFNYGDDAPRIGAIGKKHIKNSLQKKQTILSDFHFAADSSDIHLDIISSFDRSVNRYNNMIGGILFRIDPSIDLYPLIQTWPKPSETAEMLLIRQEGNSVQYLNELRHAKKMALKLRLPLNSENSLAVLALRGTTGIVEGKDYRGVDVRAAIFKIPDTPWFLISKIDKNEIEHPLRERMLSLVIIVTLLVLIAGTVIFFIGYRQRAHFIRNQFQMELDRKAILAHFDYLVKYSSDIYLLLDEKLFIVEANERALSTYGYTREEIQNLSISDLLSQFEKDFESKKLTLVKDEDSAVFELLQKRKDGITIPVEMSIRLLTIENIKYYQCIARNISERKSAERALRDSEERYRKIFMDNPNPMWVYDIETLRFLEVNSKAINHYGYTRDEFLSMTIADIRPDEDVSRLLENVSSLTDGFDDAGVWRHRKKDGTIIYVEITSHIINHGGRKAEIILSHDVTERILMEEMVKSAQQHLRELATIINSSPIVAFLWSASPGWPVIFVSENVTQLGYTVEEFISGKISYEQIIHPDDLERIIEETLKYAQEGIDEFNQLYRIVTSSGTVRYVDDRTVVRRNTNGTPTHFQGILVDITARVEAEEWVEQVLDNTPEAVFFVDVLPDEVFRFNRLNRAEETAIGVRNVEVQGKTPDECLPPELAERVTKKYQQCFHEGKSISYEEELELPSGKKVWNTVLVPIRNLDGRIYRIVGFSRDITERKLYEVVLQRQSVAMNAAIDGMAILDENESYIYVNDAHARVYGYESGEELVGKKWHILYDDAERHRFQKEIMPLMVQQGHWHGEACGRKKDGSSFPQEVSLTQIESGGLICVVRDISERRKAEEKFRKSEEKIVQNAQQQSLILQSVPIIFYTAEFSESIATIWISDQVKQITGYEPDNFLENKNFWETRLHPEDKNKAIDEYRKVLKSGSAISEYRWLCADNTYRWFSDQITTTYDHLNQPKEVVGIWIDITNRKHAEEALEKSESRYKALVESSRDVIFQLSPEGKFLFVNTTGAATLSLSRDRISDYSLENVFIPDVSRFLRETLHKVIETRKALYIEYPFTVSGEKKYYSTILVPILNQGREVESVIGIGRDITERKNSEEALRESELRYRTLVETLPDGISLFDKAGKILFANHRKAELLGYSGVEEIIGTSTFNMFAADQMDDAMAMQNHLLNVGFISGVEFLMRRKDGSTFIAEFTASVVRDPDGAIVGIMDVMRDVTERKRSEEQLRKLSRAIDQSPSCIIITDVRGRIEYVNPRFTSLTGYTFEEVEGQTPRILKSGEKNAEEYEELWNIIISGKEWRGEFHNKKKNGDLYWETAVISPILGNEGKITHFVAVKEDVTEKKSLEAQLLRAQRMESLGTLAGGIAHDLNNVLSPIMLSIDLLKDRAIDERSIRLLDTIESSATRGRDIIKQVLTFARGLEGKKVTIQIKHILKEILQMLNETFPKSINLSLDIREELWFIAGNVTQIHQVLLNLCVNARDAMLHGGKLTISAENKMIDKSYAGMNIDSKPGPYLKVSVQDSGVGIPPHLLDKIFEPFFTTKEIGKGTGLGLSTAHSIVKTHGGFISIDSHIGKGTRFDVYFPAVQGDEKEKIERTAYRLPAGNGELIMIIEDEKSILEITQHTLEYYNYRVTTAQDGTEAISQFAAIGNEVEVVITDIMMPVLDGIATSRTLRKLRPDIKIILTSGLRTTDPANELIDVEIQAFLQKPFTAEKLLSTLYDVIHKPSS